MMTESAWYVASLLMTIAMFLSGTIIGLFRVTKDWTKRIISWIVPVVLSIAAYYIGLYQVTEPVWLGIATTAIVVALSSNGLFNIPDIKDFVQKLFKYKK